MWPDRVLNQGPLVFELDTVTIELRGPAKKVCKHPYSRNHFTLDQSDLPKHV